MSRAGPSEQDRLSPVAIAAFFRLADAWQLRDDSARQLLGGVSNGTFSQVMWPAGEA